MYTHFTNNIFLITTYYKLTKEDSEIQKIIEFWQYTESILI